MNYLGYIEILSPCWRQAIEEYFKRQAPQEVPVPKEKTYTFSVETPYGPVKVTFEELRGPKHE